MTSSPEHAWGSGSDKKGLVAVLKSMAAEMETMLEAIERLRSNGYRTDWYAQNGHLHCRGCQLTTDPSRVVVDDIVRFEGDSDPGDEAILFALGTSDGHHGIYITAYGPETPTADLDVVAALQSNHPRNYDPKSDQ